MGRRAGRRHFDGPMLNHHQRSRVSLRVRLAYNRYMPLATRRPASSRPFQRRRRSPADAQVAQRAYSSSMQRTLLPLKQRQRPIDVHLGAGGCSWPRPTPKRQWRWRLPLRWRRVAVGESCLGGTRGGMRILSMSRGKVFSPMLVLVAPGQTTLMRISHCASSTAAIWRR